MWLIFEPYGDYTCKAIFRFMFATLQETSSLQLEHKGMEQLKRREAV